MVGGPVSKRGSAPRPGDVVDPDPSAKRIKVAKDHDQQGGDLDQQRGVPSAAGQREELQLLGEREDPEVLPDAGNDEGPKEQDQQQDVDAEEEAQQQGGRKVALVLPGVARGPEVLPDADHDAAAPQSGAGVPVAEPQQRRVENDPEVLPDAGVPAEGVALDGVVEVQANNGGRGGAPSGGVVARGGAPSGGVVAAVAATPELKIGQAVEYNSPSFGQWISAIVTGFPTDTDLPDQLSGIVHPDQWLGSHVHLNVRFGALRSEVRLPKKAVPIRCVLGADEEPFDAGPGAHSSTAASTSASRGLQPQHTVTVFFGVAGESAEFSFSADAEVTVEQFKHYLLCEENHAAAARACWWGEAGRPPYKVFALMQEEGGDRAEVVGEWGKQGNHLDAGAAGSSTADEEEKDGFELSDSTPLVGGAVYRTVTKRKSFDKNLDLADLVYGDHFVWLYQHEWEEHVWFKKVVAAEQEGWLWDDLLKEIPMAAGDAGFPFGDIPNREAERLRNLDHLISHVSHYDGKNARGDLPTGMVSRNNWSENWNRFWNRRDSSGNFAHAAMISYARVVQVLGRFGVRQESRRKFAGLAFSLLGNDNYQPDASTWLGSNFTACFISVHPGSPFSVTQYHSEMGIYSAVHLAIEARRYSILHDLLTSATATHTLGLGARHFDAEVQLFPSLSRQLIYLQADAEAQMWPRRCVADIVKHVWELHVWPSHHTASGPKWSDFFDEKFSLFGSIFGVVLREASSTVAEAFFSHPAASTAALVDGGPSLGKQRAMFRPFPVSQTCALDEAYAGPVPHGSRAVIVPKPKCYGGPSLGKQRAMFRPFPVVSQTCALDEAYAGPVPHGSRAVIVPKPKCSWLSMLHMALLRQNYSEKLVTILLHNPALTTVKDLNLRSNFDESGLPADGLCPKERDMERELREKETWEQEQAAMHGQAPVAPGGALRRLFQREAGWLRSGRFKERYRWVPDLNPLPILFTSILLGPSRWGAALQILRHPDLSANHLNFYLPLTESHLDSGENEEECAQERNPAINDADSVFGDSRRDMIRAARAAVVHLVQVQEGHQDDGAAEGSQGTLIDHMAPRFKMALAMGGCSALGLLFAVCGPGGVDAAHAAEATPVVLAMLEHPLLDVPKAMGQKCGRGPGYKALMERIDIMWPCAAAEETPQERAGDGVIVARVRALRALAQK